MGSLEFDIVLVSKILTKLNDYIIFAR